MSGIFFTRVPEMALNNFLFLTILETSHTFKTIVQFSRIKLFQQIICVENLSLYLSICHEIQLFLVQLFYILQNPQFFQIMNYLALGTSSIHFFSGFGASIFFYRVRRLHKGVPKVAKVLIPKSIPTELSVLGNTSWERFSYKTQEISIS